MEAFKPHEDTETISTRETESQNLNLIANVSNNSQGEAQLDINMSVAVPGIEQIRAGIARLFEDEANLTSTIEPVAETVIEGPVAPTKPHHWLKTLESRTRNMVSALNKETTLTVRKASEDDIDSMVEVDLASFKSVYKHYDMPREQLRAELRQKFETRFNKVGKDWVTILEKEGQVAGFIMACPTNKPPEEFVSWEDNTDNGTLDTTYAADGKYIFIVSLSVMGNAANLGGQNMLALSLIAKLTSRDYQAYFESRVPGLKRWAMHRCREDGIKFADMSEVQERQYANEYYEHNVVEGKYSDPLLKLYHDIGCKFVKLVPNAYQDELSLNYGVVTTIQSPLPEYLQKVPPVRKIAGLGLGMVARSRRLTERMV